MLASPRPRPGREIAAHPSPTAPLPQGHCCATMVSAAWWCGRYKRQTMGELDEAVLQQMYETTAYPNNLPRFDPER